ncbi:hypothetical protein [Branchiibius sp. NY16-3462-2]|uniref:hypothetical protein n=1 Tax=Branchiibius sp. NY16-3462-2 TaxID=1807500 RepID=UPI00079C8F63|nr:hypothetical protein [Branchiibius sp. NY16-3462-2]KYH44754.1 hypothetical protein AZH51_12065 [Branchiibius sp. NY16-3462-2]
MMRAIPQTYAGVRFRSTLEADWAVNLDALRMVWQYEPEGVVMPSGTYYRCDMYLPRLSTFVEVKGPHNERLWKPGELATATMHAPGCAQSRPVEVSGLHEDCACGFGPSFPWRFVVVARPGERGRMVFHAALDEAKAVIALCSVCMQYSFADVNAPWHCRRCRGSGAVKVLRSGDVTFRQIDHEAGKHRARRQAATRGTRAQSSRRKAG